MMGLQYLELYAYLYRQAIKYDGKQYIYSDYFSPSSLYVGTYLLLVHLNIR